MQTKLPLLETVHYSTANFVSRILGMWFLSAYINRYGLSTSGQLRTLLPILGIAAAAGTIGLPQAVVRFTAAYQSHTKRCIPFHHLLASGLCAVVSSILGLCVLAVLWIPLASRTHLSLTDSTRWMSFGLLILMGISAWLRSIFTGLGDSRQASMATIVEVLVRLGLILFVGDLPKLSSGLNEGIFIWMASEFVTVAFLTIGLVWSIHKQSITIPFTPIRRRDFIHSCLQIARLSIAPIALSMTVSVGFAMEFPLAEFCLESSMPVSEAMTLLGAYGSVVLPILCAPMLFTDGLATALLPRIAMSRTNSSEWLASVLRMTGVIAFPAGALLFLLAPPICQWYGAPTASPILMPLAWLAFPLYLYSPLASFFQGIGRSRYLLIAGFIGDCVRLSGLWLCLSVWHWKGDGLIVPFSISVLVTTGFLLYVAVRRLRIRTIPWSSLTHLYLSTVGMTAILIVGIHVHMTWGFSSHPVPWMAAALLWVAVYLHLSGEGSLVYWLRMSALHTFQVR